MGNAQRQMSNNASPETGMGAGTCALVQVERETWPTNIGQAILLSEWDGHLRSHGIARLDQRRPWLRLMSMLFARHNAYVAYGASPRVLSSRPIDLHEARTTTRHEDALDEAIQGMRTPEVQSAARVNRCPENALGDSARCEAIGETRQRQSPRTGESLQAAYRWDCERYNMISPTVSTLVHGQINMIHSSNRSKMARWACLACSL